MLLLALVSISAQVRITHQNWPILTVPNGSLHCTERLSALYRTALGVGDA
jgi:hypothetical protein